MVEMKSEIQVIRNCEGLLLLSNTDYVESLTDSITYTESSMEAKSPFSSTQSKELSQSNKQKKCRSQYGNTE